jgi:hypothetical protein
MKLINALQNMMEGLGGPETTIVYDKDKSNVDFYLDDLKNSDIRFKKAKVVKAKGWKGYALYVIFHSLADKIRFFQELGIALDGPSDPRADIQKELRDEWAKKNYKL